MIIQHSTTWQLLPFGLQTCSNAVGFVVWMVRWHLTGKVVKLTVQPIGLQSVCSVQSACAGANDCLSGDLLSAVVYCADHCLSCVFSVIKKLAILWRNYCKRRLKLVTACTVSGASCLIRSVGPSTCLFNVCNICFIDVVYLVCIVQSYLLYIGTAFKTDMLCVWICVLFWSIWTVVDITEMV